MRFFKNDFGTLLGTTPIHAGLQNNFGTLHGTLPLLEHYHFWNIPSLWGNYHKNYHLKTIMLKTIIRTVMRKNGQKKPPKF